MELKDVILSTLAEMEDNSAKPQPSDFEVKEKITKVKETKPVENISEFTDRFAPLLIVKSSLIVAFPTSVFVPDPEIITSQKFCEPSIC